MNYDYKVDKEHGITTCTININGIEIIGTARKAPEDRYSDFFGHELATARAEIKAYKYVIKTEFQPRYDALHQLYHSVDMSKSYQKNSHEARAIRRHLYMAKNDIEYMKSLIKEREDYIQFSLDSLKKVEN